MIQLNVDFSLLNKFFGIPINKISQYANKDLEEIMKIEAAQGNQKAADYKEILSDPDKLIKIFKLTNVENKYIILQNLSEEDLDNLLPYLKQEQLARGLNFFTEEKLMEMCAELPIEPLLQMVLEKFTILDILVLMDEDSLDKFIKQPDSERKYAQKYFETLDKKTLEQIMVYSFGADFYDKDKKEYLEHLENLNDRKYQEFLLSMERESKIGLINGMISQQEDLALLLDPEDVIAPMSLLMKADKVKLMGSLDAEYLIPMIQELPEDLVQIVLTQIDARDFSEVLARDFEDILSSVVLFSTKMG